MKNIYKVKGNLYITNNDEIKDGDWFITNNNEIFKCIKNKEEQCFYSLNASILTKFCKKIILTTHELLIKDEVQSIDKYFLIWLINNPNCEQVWVYYDLFEFEKDSKRKKYTIIFLKKEQPKQGIDIQEFEKKANEIIANVGKKETLEDAVDKYTPLRIEQKAFIAGAEYQAKRMYSEKEVLEIIRQYALEEHLITSSKPDIWFEQFKKK